MFFQTLGLALKLPFPALKINQHNPYPYDNVLKKFRRFPTKIKFLWNTEEISFIHKVLSRVPKAQT
jgi:hypothetical protein